MTLPTVSFVAAPAPELVERSEDMLAVARSYVIDCAEMREAASHDLKQIKRLAADVEAQRKSITTPMDLAKSRVMALFKRPADYLALAEDTIKRACLKWDNAEDQRRRQLEAEAAQRADDERKRLALEAQKAAAAGNVETAHAIAEAAQMVAPVPVQFERTKVAGESTRELWHWELDDLRALARAVADGVIATENILPNAPVLNGQARALKGACNIPGGHAVMTKSLASRAA